jgi:hypothetical protein
LFVEIFASSEIKLNEISFDTCKTTGNGGALYARFTDGGTLTITGTISFTSCETTGFGGGF